VNVILLVDDHAMFREGLVLAIAHAAPDFVVKTASNGAEALAVLESRDDIVAVMLDYYLPDISGTALLRRLCQARPGIRILVLSASEDTDDVNHALSCGARGFIHKSASIRELIDALNTVIDGKHYVPHFSLLMNSPAFERDESSLLNALTPRQLEVLRLACDGLRNSDISLRLGTTEKTVKAHMSAVLAGLGVVNRTQAVLVARRGGLFWKTGITEKRG
jgi:DNA-binding NarL/FixJ family response regulator